jgi:hypothetical protein
MREATADKKGKRRFEAFFRPSISSACSLSTSLNVKRKIGGAID